MCSPVTVRRLGPADVMLLRKLNSLFGEAFDDHDTYGGEPPDDTYVAKLLGERARCGPGGARR